MLKMVISIESAIQHRPVKRDSLAWNLPKPNVFMACRTVNASEIDYHNRIMAHLEEAFLILQIQQPKCWLKFCVLRRPGLTRCVYSISLQRCLPDVAMPSVELMHPAHFLFMTTATFKTQNRVKISVIFTYSCNLLKINLIRNRMVALIFPILNLQMI